MAKDIQQEKRVKKELLKIQKRQTKKTVKKLRKENKKLKRRIEELRLSVAFYKARASQYDSDEEFEFARKVWAQIKINMQVNLGNRDKNDWKSFDDMYQSGEITKEEYDFYSEDN